MHRGFTLLELTVGLFLAGLTLSVSLPAARRSLDRMAVVGAREAVVGLLSRVRSEAVRRGGASLVIDTDGFVSVEVGGKALDSVDLAAQYEVTIGLSGSGERAEIRFDALGIGRLASRTVEFRRGSAVTFLIVSSYGRVTRR